VCDVLPQLSYEEDSTIQLACRVVANLAANHPNNQHKLGASGACEFLLSVLNELCLGNKTDPAAAAVTTRAACWAMANLIESSKSANEDKRLTLSILDNMNILDTKSPLKMLGESRQVKNSQKLLDLDIVTVLLALLKQYSSDASTLLWVLYFFLYIVISCFLTYTVFWYSF
jgi:hypothetical protein